MFKFKKYFSWIAAAIILWAIVQHHPAKQQIDSNQAADTPAIPLNVTNKPSLESSTAPLEKAPPGREILGSIFQNMGFIGVLKDDIKAGSGAPVLCGQQVEIKYKAYTADNKQFASSGNKTLLLTIGEGKVIRGLESGLIGMRLGSERKLKIPARLGFDDPRFSSERTVPPNSQLLYHISIISYKPTFDQGKDATLKIYDDTKGTGEEVFCGMKGVINYKILDMEGNLLASTFGEENISMPVVFDSFSDNMPYGLQLALTGNGDRPGMQTGGRRTAIVPANFLKTSKGKPAAIELLPGKELPANQTVIIEIELIKIEN